MLEFQLPDDRPLLVEGITCKLTGGKLSIPEGPFISDFCFCEFVCETPLLAFAGVTEREKDFYTLYYQNTDLEGSTAFFIVDNGTDIELEDGVHGTAIDHGFIVDFTEIFNRLGHGKYSFRIDINQFGSNFFREYKYFQVTQFDDILADGTVKIESVQNGEIESQFSYNNVPFSIRVYGKFGDMQEKYDAINNDTYSRLVEQVHVRTFFEYSLEINTNQHDFMLDVIKNYSLGSTILISDYNIRNQFVHNKVSVTRSNEAIQIENQKESRYGKYVIKFQEAIQDNIKHPFS